MAAMIDWTVVTCGLTVKRYPRKLKKAMKKAGSPCVRRLSATLVLGTEFLSAVAVDWSGGACERR